MGNTHCCDTSLEGRPDNTKEHVYIQQLDPFPKIDGALGNEVVPTSQGSAAAADNGARFVATTSSPQSTSEFTITLYKESAAKWGMLLKPTEDDRLMIIAPTGEAIAVHHRQNPSRMVKRGDEILSISGITGAKAIIAAMKDLAQSELTLRRTTRILVEITKQEVLGIILDPKTNKVTNIVNGRAIDQYNQVCLPNLAVTVGDTLVEVNGAGVSKNLIEELARCKDGDVLRLVFEREGVGLSANSSSLAGSAVDK